LQLDGSDFENNRRLRDLPLVVPTKTSDRAVDVEVLGGGTAIALPLIPSPNTCRLAVIRDAAGNGKDWLRETLTDEEDRVA